MNSSNHKFRVLRITPNLIRGERLNVGLLLMNPDGKCEVRLHIVRDRLAALDPNLTAISWESWAKHVMETINQLPQELVPAWLERGLNPVHADSHDGVFIASSAAEFEEQVQMLLERLVIRPTRQHRAPRSKGKQPTQLQAQFKNWFKGAQILGRSMEDISRHQIVQEYPVSLETDSFADFAFKNGALHILETLDLRGVDHLTARLRNQAAFKSIVLDQASAVTVGGGRRIAVVAATDYASVKPAIRLIERSADDLISMDSPNDVQRLVEHLTVSLHLSGQLQMPIHH